MVSPVHVVPKKNSTSDGNVDVRITIDKRDLNQALLREYHPIATVDDVMTRLEGNKLFTTVFVPTFDTSL